ncbi:MAG: MlaD family protein [Lautropia sp.]
MEPEGRYTVIGVLVLLLAATATAALVWLTGYNRAAQATYTIYFERQSLRGLQVGGDVNIRGLKVGQVLGYEISPANVNRVKVNVRLDANTPIAENTSAIIGRNLVTGVARVDLETPNPPGERLSTVPRGETFPVIDEGASEFDVITDAFNRIAVTGEAALSNLNSLLTDENLRAFNETMAATRDLMTGLSDRLAVIDRVGRDLAGTADSLQRAGTRVATSIERTSGVLSNSIEPLARRTTGTLADVQALLGAARKTLADVGQAVGGLERASTQAAGKAADAADIGLLEFRATARELRSGIENLSRTLDQLQDPRSALLGPGEGQLGPGERKR